jgi:hypothetical protein
LFYVRNAGNVRFEKVRFPLPWREGIKGRGAISFCHFIHPHLDPLPSREREPSNFLRDRHEIFYNKNDPRSKIKCPLGLKEI